MSVLIQVQILTYFIHIIGCPLPLGAFIWCLIWWHEHHTHSCSLNHPFWWWSSGFTQSQHRQLKVSRQPAASFVLIDEQLLAIVADWYNRTEKERHWHTKPALRDPWNKVSYGLLITVGRLVVWSRGLSAKCNFSDFSAGILGRLNCCSKGSFLSFVCVYAQIWSVPVQFVLNEQYTLYACL